MRAKQWMPKGSKVSNIGRIANFAVIDRNKNIKDKYVGLKCAESSCKWLNEMYEQYGEKEGYFGPYSIIDISVNTY